MIVFLSRAILLYQYLRDVTTCCTLRRFTPETCHSQQPARLENYAHSHAQSCGSPIHRIFFQLTVNHTHDSGVFRGISKKLQKCTSCKRTKTQPSLVLTVHCGWWWVQWLQVLRQPQVSESPNQLESLHDPTDARIYTVLAGTRPSGHRVSIA